MKPPYFAIRTHPEASKIKASAINVVYVASDGKETQLQGVRRLEVICDAKDDTYELVLTANRFDIDILADMGAAILREEAENDDRSCQCGHNREAHDIPSSTCHGGGRCPCRGFVRDVRP